MINLRMLRHSDKALWLSSALLVFLGFIVMFSANAAGGKVGADALLYLKRHFFSLLIGLAAMVGAAYVDYNYFKRFAVWIYVLMLGLLLGVMFVGDSASGAQRWISLGFFSFQPSEFAKLMLIVVAASYLENKKRKINNIFQLLPFLALISLPFILIFKQPDLGTALVFVAIFLGMLAFSEALPLLFVVLLTPFLSIIFQGFLFAWIGYLALLFVVLYLFRVQIFNLFLVLGVNLGVGLAFPLIWGMLREYQKQRILTFLNPAADPLGAGYHTLQSKIAIGSGLIWGKGFLKGTQTQLQFIPIQSSDFIFAVIAEEFGFIGGAILFSLFMLVVYRAFTIAFESQDFFGGLLAAGIGVMLLFHVFVNLGMTMGILPVVGIPLPLVSFGGSSLVVTLVSIGILQSIAMRRHKLIF